MKNLACEPIKFIKILETIALVLIHSPLFKISEIFFILFGNVADTQAFSLYGFLNNGLREAFVPSPIRIVHCLPPIGRKVKVTEFYLGLQNSQQSVFSGPWWWVSVCARVCLHSITTRYLRNTLHRGKGLVPVSSGASISLT